MLKRFEFMSPTWIAMAREQILRALDGKDLRTIRFTLCEEFTNPPEHLRPSGAQSIGFYVRLRDGRVERPTRRSHAILRLRHNGHAA